jgi:ribonuclease HI
MNMTTPTPITIRCDGLCEPVNPGGYACYGWVAYDQNGKELAKDANCIGNGPGMTNNVAEYNAVIRALAWCYKSGHIEDVHIESDSQLVICQITGDYSCNSQNLYPLLQRIRRAAQYVKATYNWIPREKNTEADKLSRYAYKQATGRTAAERRR